MGLGDDYQMVTVLDDKNRWRTWCLILTMISTALFLLLMGVSLHYNQTNRDWQIAYRTKILEKGVLQKELDEANFQTDLLQNKLDEADLEKSLLRSKLDKSDFEKRNQFHRGEYTMCVYTWTYFGHPDPRKGCEEIIRQSVENKVYDQETPGYTPSESELKNG